MACRFEDIPVEYVGIDKSLFGQESMKATLQIYKCNIPATNAVWGEQAAQPTAAVMGSAQIIDVRTAGQQVPEAAIWKCAQGEIDEGWQCLEPAICDEYDPNNPRKEIKCSRQASRRPKSAACKPGQYYVGSLCWNSPPTPDQLRKYR